MEDVDYGSYLLLFVPRWLKGFVQLSQWNSAGQAHLAVRSLAARYLTNINGRVDLVQGYLHDLLQKRVQDMESSGGDWEDKPVSILYSLLIL